MRFRIFGDSHTEFFKSSLMVPHNAILPDDVEVEVNTFAAASIAGFRKRKTTLNVKGTLEHTISDIQPSDVVVLSFGQNDLELGQYFRRCVKEDNSDPKHFLLTAIKSYLELASKIAAKAPVWVKGINPTVLRTPSYASRVISRAILKDTKDPQQRKRATSLLKEVDLGPERLGSETLWFNEQLRTACERAGIPYLDLVDKLGDPHQKGLARWSHIQANSDIHLADTRTVRFQHVNALKAIMLQVKESE